MAGYCDTAFDTAILYCKERAREKLRYKEKRVLQTTTVKQIKKKIKIVNSRKRNSFPLLSIVKRSHLFFGLLHPLPQS
jgi:hypothetical protein